MSRVFFTICVFISLRISLGAEQRDSCRPEQMRCEKDNCVSSDSNCKCSLDCTSINTQLPKYRESRDATLDRISETCVLPPYPKQGTYKVANVENSHPGQTFDSLMLTVSCRRGYGVVSSDNNMTEIGRHVYCINGKWLQNMPKCVRFCKLTPDPSIRYNCLVPGAGFKLCGTYVAPGTTVSPQCNHLYYSADDLPYMTCISGYWDNMPRCQADCGLITPEGEQLVIGGELAQRGELPWHVGIYLKTTEPFKQICGGSLISSNVVLSAAHCFWDDVTKLRPASDYAVAIGKLYRAWYHAKDIGQQESDVKQIKVPILFKGEATHFQDDIAVVFLAKAFTYKPFIRPVCVNFVTSFDTYQLQLGKSGKVAGWGLTRADGGASQALKVVSLPYIKTDTCIDTVPPAFTQYITSDKFCAGYINGTALCKGDSGGGLAFAEKEQGRYRYYLRGIVSTAPRHDTKKCNDATLTAFTKIKKHEEFIKSTLAGVDKSCPWYLFQCKDGSCVDQGSDCDGKPDCADGSDEAVELCTPETDDLDVLSDRACVFPEVPQSGWFRVVNTSHIPNPGRILRSFVLVVNCAKFYSLISSEGRLVHGYYKVACVDGVWSEKMPECITYCAADYDPIVRYKCRELTLNEPMICNKYRRTGHFCNGVDDYSHLIKPDPDIKCVSNTSKDMVMQCKEDCGQVVEAEVAVDGKMVRRELAPWHVTIYEKNGDDYFYHCGGTLVSNNVVISAADTFWDPEKGHIRISKWGAAAGQTYRLWDDQKNINAQKTEVKGITVPDTYAGKSRGFEKDIAVIVLLDPFVLNTFVKHACLDWDTELDTQQLQPVTIGKVVGWDRASENSSLSQEVVELETESHFACDNYLPWFQQDQICAKYTEEKVKFLSSNIGSGLVYIHNGSGVERHYLRGVLTTKCLNAELCYIEPDHAYATFTRLSALKDFIQRYTLL